MPSPDAPAPRLRAIEVGHTYAGRTPTHALGGVTLDVPDHEFVAIVGPVGCGKTTLLRIIAGFLRPMCGTILCDGVPVSGPGADRGYVFQEDAIFPWMTVAGNVEFGLRAKGMDAPARKAITAEWIALIGLEGYEAAYPRELSAGMAKMVEAARVLATDPSILLLDEPFASLDAQTRANMQDQMSGLWEKSRKTVLLVTHDVEEAIYLADRILVFSPRPGRIKEEVRVPLPRPRGLGVRFAPESVALKQRIWEALRTN